MTAWEFAPAELAAYRAPGYHLIPLHVPDALDRKGRPIGKAPLESGWRQSPHLSVEEAREHMLAGGNVGIRLREEDLVLDVDPRNFAKGDDPLARLQTDLGVDLTGYPTVRTGSGGKHIYMRKPADALLRDTLEAYQGVEFKAHGRQVVAAGSVHPGDAKRGVAPGGGYRWDDDVLAVPLSAVKDAPADLIEIARRPGRIAAVDAGGRTPEQLASMLDGLEPADYKDHSRWLELMMAAHHSTGGEGRQEWIDWSTGDPDYADDGWSIGRRWDSLHADGGGTRVTEKTLFKALVDAGRGDLLPRTTAEEDFRDQVHEVQPDPTDDWVWVADATVFVRRSDGKKYGREQWKSMYAPLYPDGDVLTAVWKKKLSVRKFESLTYLPGSSEFPDGEFGGRYNIWKRSGVVPTPGDVQPFLGHMEYMIPDETERGQVLDYMALMLQRPGEKIHFALLLQGGQGTGKSWVGRLMERMIGEPNVARPSNDEVTSHWTAWMEGVQLGVIEELMARGRLEVANRLKPVITDGTIRIEEKGRSHYSIPNHLNLMCFTNHPDALKLERGDRRWFVVFSPAEPRLPEYYEDLFGFLAGDGPCAVADWLLKRDVLLNPKGVAPDTAAKTAMLQSSIDEIEGWVRDKLEERAGPFNCDLVRLDDVLEALPADLKAHGSGARSRVALALRAVGAVEQTRYTKGDRGRPAVALWSVRDHEFWEDKGAAARIDVFMAKAA